MSLIGRLLASARAALRGVPALPEGAAAYLRAGNPRLRELKARIEALDHPATRHAHWSADFVSSAVDLRSFRGDNAYLWQRRDRNTQTKHALTARYLRSLDRTGLLQRLKEDLLFGVETFRSDDGSLVSRDLLDSVAEIEFLERHLGLSVCPGVRVLDIGAGYGRLAHRMAEAFPAMERILCVDAVAESTFLCEYYLRFRGASPRAQAVPLYDVEATLASHPVQLALNVHSFSECSLAVIEWWLDLIKRHAVRHLFLVPNADRHGGEQLLSHEADGRKLDMTPSLLARGYRLAAREPKFCDPVVQQQGISPTFHYLFERATSG